MQQCDAHSAAHSAASLHFQAVLGLSVSGIMGFWFLVMQSSTGVCQQIPCSQKQSASSSPAVPTRSQKRRLTLHSQLCSWCVPAVGWSSGLPWWASIGSHRITELREYWKYLKIFIFSSALAGCTHALFFRGCGAQQNPQGCPSSFLSGRLGAG